MECVSPTWIFLPFATFQPPWYLLVGRGDNEGRGGSDHQEAFAHRHPLSILSPSPYHKATLRPWDGRQVCVRPGWEDSSDSVTGQQPLHPIVAAFPGRRPPSHFDKAVAPKSFVMDPLSAIASTIAIIQAISTYFGLERPVGLLLKGDNVQVSSTDGPYQRSALSWASENGFDGIVKLLIKGPRIRFRDLIKPSV